MFQSRFLKENGKSLSWKHNPLHVEVESKNKGLLVFFLDTSKRAVRENWNLNHQESDLVHFITNQNAATAAKVRKNKLCFCGHFKNNFD